MIKDRIAIVGPATWDPLVPLIESAAEGHGIEAAVDIYGFGRDVAVLAGRDQHFFATKPRGVFVLQDPRDLFRNWLRDPRGDGDPAGDGTSAAQLVIDSIASLASRVPDASWIIGTLFSFHPNSGDGIGDPFISDPFSTAIAAYNRELSAAREAGGYLVFDQARLQWEWGSRTLLDPRMYQLARFPGSAEGLRLLAGRIASFWAAVTGRTKKVLALDCDNTLWGGVVGEEGVDGIQIGDDGIGRAYSMFQEVLLSLESRGVLLALCSRNNPVDVEEVFLRRAEMVIPRDRIAATSIGWGAKSEGLKQLASELGLGLESVVFIDDNPREREEVRQALPMVTVPEFPDDPADLFLLAGELSWKWFYRLHLSKEDHIKTEQYRARAEGEKLRAEVHDPTDFLRSLEMSAEIHVDDATLVNRMAQLTQKTNQFNLTLNRYTEAEVRDLLADPNCHLLAASLRDRFGDHGVVSLLIARQTPSAWQIDVLLMSCRVLGRGFEQAFMTSAIEYLWRLRPLPMEGVFVEGPRNSQVSSFYTDLGFDSRTAPSGQVIYEFPLERDMRVADGYIAITWEQMNE